MGAFDEIAYNGKVYQTKSFPCPWQERYEVRGDQLWHEEYDTEDRSNPNAKGIARIFGMCTPINQRWVKLSFTGTVYSWGEIALTFEEGKLVKVQQWDEEVSREMDMND